MCFNVFFSGFHPAFGALVLFQPGFDQRHQGLCALGQMAPAFGGQHQQITEETWRGKRICFERL